MSIPSPATTRQRGVGKLEFVLLIAVIGVVAAMQLQRLAAMEQEAERTEVGLTVRNMRVGLSLAVGERLMRGQEDHLPELLEANPVSFLGYLPRGYVAEPGDSANALGTWRFDHTTHILSYRPRQPEAFDGQTELRWRTVAHGLLGGRVVGVTIESLPY